MCKVGATVFAKSPHSSEGKEVGFREALATLLLPSATTLLLLSSTGLASPVCRLDSKIIYRILKPTYFIPPATAAGQSPLHLAETLNYSLQSSRFADGRHPSGHQSYTIVDDDDFMIKTETQEDAHEASDDAHEPAIDAHETANDAAADIQTAVK